MRFNPRLLHWQANSCHCPYLGSPDPWKEKKKMAPTLPEQSQELHLLEQWVSYPWEELQVGRDTELQLPQEHIRVTSPNNTRHQRKSPPHQGCKEPPPLNWVGREERSQQIRTEPLGRTPDEERTGAQGPPWRDPSAHHALGTAALAQPWVVSAHSCCEPRGPTGETQETWLLSWDMHPFLLLEQVEGDDQMLPRTWPVLLGSPCAPQPINAPLAPLDPVHSHWGQGHPCWAEWAVVEYRSSSDQQDVWIGQGCHQRGSPRSSVLEISFSISLTVKSF